jgi:Family of unknown function (DUF5681)
MTAESSQDDRAVGYKKPPLHSRFQPGKSGNPRGKQKGVRNLGSDVKRTLEVPVRLNNEQGKARRVSSQEAALLRLREKALKGDARSLDRFLELAQTFNNNDAAIVTIAFDRREDALAMDSIVRRIRMAEDLPADAGNLCDREGKS